jgi:hypothetical protein
MRPGYSEPIKMHVNGWGDYLFKSTFFDQTLNGGQGALRTPTLDELKTRLNNYRWVSIADAQRLHQNLGIPFWFEELAVPANLLIRNAAWTVLDSRDGPGFGGIQISRAVGFVNQDNGQWVLDSDANGAIRANVDPVDYCCYFMSWGSNPGVQVLYDADYGELHERFYVGEDLPVPATQLIRANKYYLYRRYGGRQARSVVFPRNYADFERNYDSTIVRYFAPGGFQHIPRVAVEHEEGLPAEVTDLGSEHLPLNPDESVITTTFENGQLSIYPYGEAF